MAATVYFLLYVTREDREVGTFEAFPVFAALSQVCVRAMLNNQGGVQIGQNIENVQDI